MAALTLNISILEPHAGWQASWHLDEQPIGRPIDATGAAAQSVADVSQRFLELFEQDSRPLSEPDALRAIGRMLFELWFEPVWETIEPRLIGGAHELLVRCNDRQVLNLPWELIELHPDLPLGCDAAWSLRRTPVERLAATDGKLEPGPLRVLFLAAAPIDQHQLDYEREEDAMLRATGRLRQEVAVCFAEMGSFAELEELVARCQPHVVHLSGHGAVLKGSGTFAFEDEHGHSDSREAAEIVSDVFRGTSVRCVFLNGCQTSQAAVAGLCQALVRAGLPLAIGWAASVADDMATEFAETYYRRLLSGESVGRAVAHARNAIRRRGRIRRAGVELQDATFALPQVYCSVAGDELFDRAAPPVARAVPRTEYALLGDGIRGLREGFVGRRRQVQRLLPALRDGDKTFAVITGIGGAGKSTLATRAANRLESGGYRILPVRTAEGTGPAECARRTLDKLIDVLDRAFVAEKREDLHGLITDGKVPLAQRLRLAMDALNELRLALVLDNFEDALQLETRTIADPDLADSYRHLAGHLTRGSCVIVTCRYLPAETATDLATLVHLPLPDLEQHNFLKFLRRDAEVDRRIRQGELPAGLLTQLHRDLGGTPGFLETVRRVLRTADPAELSSELSGLAPGALSEERERYYQQIFAARLYAALPPHARKLASRLALSELPLPLDAVSQLLALGDNQTLPLLAGGVAFGLVEEFAAADLPTLYDTPGLLRPWLCAPERLANADAVHVHARLAAFWRASYEEDREQALRVPIDVELAVCRLHARLASERLLFRWATVGLARRLERRCEWRTARELLEEVPEAERDADCLLALASVESSLGDWKTARSHLQHALGMIPEGTEDKAATWHQLASIDVAEGHYAAAREKFGKSLQITQAIGNRAGEVATFFQLGVLADRMGRTADAAPLLAVCWMIDQAIGHGDAEKDLRAFLGLCKKLEYSDEQVKAVLAKAAAAYKKDRGHSLIDQAFA